MFELNQLRCFTAVAAELSFSRAAQKMNMTQPPLSRQIQLLEHHLGVQLFERTTRTVSLTPAGRAFYSEALHLLECASNAAATARRIAAGDIGAVTISFVSCAVFDFLSLAINQLSITHPQIAITLREMVSFRQYEGIRLRQVDLGIVRAGYSDSEFISESLLKEPFILAIPRDHRLAALSGPLRVEDLDNAPFITYARSAWQPFHELFAGLFQAHGVRPRYLHQIGSTVTMLSLVNGGLGMALVPACAAGLRFKNVMFREIDLGRGIHSELSLVWREDNDNPVLTILRQTLRQAVRQAQSGLAHASATAR